MIWGYASTKTLRTASLECFKYFQPHSIQSKMKCTIIFAFALTLVVAMVASTPIENSEDDSVDQSLISQTGVETLSERSKFCR